MVAAAISCYLDRFIDICTLIEILEDKAWDSSTPLISKSLLVIYEFDHGDWTEPELRAQLRHLHDTYSN